MKYLTILGLMVIGCGQQLIPTDVYVHVSGSVKVDGILTIKPTDLTLYAQDVCAAQRYPSPTCVQDVFNSFFKYGVIQ